MFITSQVLRDERETIDFSGKRAQCVDELGHEENRTVLGKKGERILWFPSSSGLLPFENLLLSQSPLDRPKNAGR
jgi:hypothetical protein